MLPWWNSQGEKWPSNNPWNCTLYSSIFWPCVWSETGLQVYCSSFCKNVSLWINKFLHFLTQYSPHTLLFAVCKVIDFCALMIRLMISWRIAWYSDAIKYQWVKLQRNLSGNFQNTYYRRILQLVTVLDVSFFPPTFCRTTGIIISLPAGFSIIIHHKCFILQLSFG